MAKRISDIILRAEIPVPWAEGDNIPWDDPAFSERMLAEHLSQAHDLASRRTTTVDAQAAWICETVLDGIAGRVLDLACGPGLYAARLAKRGCTCEGIDFSPASIRYAQEIAAAEGLSCHYRTADLREAAFGEGYDLAMLLYGQFNVFPRDRARGILEKAYRALRPGGQLLLEVQSETQIRTDADVSPSWYTAKSGLFAAEPHLVLQERFWCEDTRTSTVRFFVVIPHGGTDTVRSFALSNEAYSLAELATFLESIGFAEFRPYPSLLGDPDPVGPDLPVVVVRK